MLTPEQIADGLRTHLESLVKRSLPELAETPVYFVFTSDGIDLGWAGGCVCENGDAIAKEIYGDKWRGRGPTVFLKWNYFWEFEWVSGGIPKGDGFIEWLAFDYHAVVAHELSHILAEASRFNPKHTGEPYHTAEPPPASQVREHMNLPRLPFEAYGQIRDSHGVYFWRLFIHVLDRIFRAADIQGAKWRLGSEAYSLSPSVEYFAAMANELREHHATPIREILEMPFSLPLLTLWNRDTAAVAASRKADEVRTLAAMPGAAIIETTSPAALTDCAGAAGEAIGGA